MTESGYAHNKFSPLYKPPKYTQSVKTITLHIMKSKPKKEVYGKSSENETSKLPVIKLPGKDTSRVFWESVKSLKANQSITQFRSETEMTKKTINLEESSGQSQIQPINYSHEDVDRKKKIQRQKTRLMGKTPHSTSNIHEHNEDSSMISEDISESRSILAQEKEDNSDIDLSPINRSPRLLNISMPFSEIPISDSFEVSEKNQWLNPNLSGINEPISEINSDLLSEEIHNLSGIIADLPQDNMPEFLSYPKYDISEIPEESVSNKVLKSRDQESSSNQTDFRMRKSSTMTYKPPPAIQIISPESHDVKREEFLAPQTHEQKHSEMNPLNLKKCDDILLHSDNPIPDNTSSRNVIRRRHSFQEDLDLKNRTTILTKEAKREFTKSFIQTQSIVNKITLREWSESQASTPAKPLPIRKQTPNLVVRTISHPVPPNRHHSCAKIKKTPLYKMQKERSDHRYHDRSETNWTPIFTRYIHLRFKHVKHPLRKSRPLLKKLLL